MENSFNSTAAKSNDSTTVEEVSVNSQTTTVESRKHEQSNTLPSAKPEAPVAEDDAAKAKRLAECAKLIKQSENDAITTQGKHLEEVSQNELFKPAFSSFEAWVTSEFDHTFQWGYQLIAAYRIRCFLIEAEVESHLIPATERAFRQLKGAKEADYKAILELAHQKGGITGKTIRAARAELEGTPKKTKPEKTPRTQFVSSFTSFQKVVGELTDVLKDCDPEALLPDEIAQLKEQHRLLGEQIKRLAPNA